MIANAVRPWPVEAYAIPTLPDTMFGLAREIDDRVLRTDFQQPGFCLVNCGSSWTSATFRRFMVDLKEVLARLRELQSTDTLVFQSVARFDQQTTTKAHLDGGPEESFLMLGYEPTAINSVIEITDYTRAAHDSGLTPTEFLERYNPMFRQGQEVLRPYTTVLNCFAPAAYQLLFVNNSYAAFGANRWQGTLHAARIPNPDEQQRRIINSTMIIPAPFGTSDVVPPDERREFTTGTQVRRQGYDKRHLSDD